MAKKDDNFTRGLEVLSSELQERIKTFADNQPLPTWHDQVRGIPNICLRSALFGVIQRGCRQASKGELIAAVKGLNIRYTGWRLDQGDFDVLSHALHLVSRQQTAENYVQFTVKGFLQGIGRNPGKSSRDWLRDSFRRLTGSAVEITLTIPRGYGIDSYTYTGSLVDEFCYSTVGKDYFLKVNPKLAKLFDAGWTQLQWHQRLQLKTDLAKWLHGFYASHRSPYPIKVGTLKHLCGSSCNRLTDFRVKLRLAMGELLAAQIVVSWHIDREDKVQVQKQDSKFLQQQD